MGTQIKSAGDELRAASRELEGAAGGLSPDEGGTPDAGSVGAGFEAWKSRLERARGLARRVRALVEGDAAAVAEAADALDEADRRAASGVGGGSR